MNRLVIIGASGHGKVVADIALKNGYQDILFLDDGINKKECAGFPVVGDTGKIDQFRDADFIVAIGNARIRAEKMKALENYHIVSLIHPDAVISRRVSIGVGTTVLAGAVINSDTSIGRGCIISTCSSVDHDNEIGDFVHVAVGAHLCGTVKVGANTWVGCGATVSNNISICPDSFIGAGALVIRSIEEPGVYVGIPASKKKN